MIIVESSSLGNLWFVCLFFFLLIWDFFFFYFLIWHNEILAPGYWFPNSFWIFIHLWNLEGGEPLLKRSAVLTFAFAAFPTASIGHTVSWNFGLKGAGCISKELGVMYLRQRPWVSLTGPSPHTQMAMTTSQTQLNWEFLLSSINISRIFEWG